MADAPDALQRLQRLERVTAGSSDGYWERNLRSNVSWYSPSFRRLIGMSIEELPDDRNIVNARIHPDDLPEFLRSYQRAIEEIGRFSYEVRYLDGQQRWRWVRGHGQAWAGADGRAEWIAGALNDIQAERDALERLAEANLRFERAIAASAEGLFERYVGEEPLYLSDRFLALVGHQRGELPPLRSAIVARFHPDDAAEAVATMRRSEHALQRWEHVFRFRHASGEYRWYRQRCIAERLADGRIRVTGMIADVHEQMLQQQELQRTRAQLEALVAERTARLQAALALAHERQLEAERANDAKSRFLAHMSHEIRTPLNGVLGLLELSQRAARQPDVQRYLETARRAGLTLGQVISTVLDFSRIEAGRTELRPRPFDAAQALIETIRQVMPMVRERGLLVMFDWTGGPHRLVGDETAFRQIATNLVGNAAKFTQRGAVTVTAGTRPEGDDLQLLTVHVEDTGPGVPEALRERVFEAFVQGDDSLARPHGGTGLGLPIARGLARAMGGDITLAPRPEGGSRFTLRLALAAAADNRPAGAAGGGGRLAWLVSTTGVGGAWLAGRMQRSGWATRLLPSIDALLEARRQAAAPALVLMSEFALVRGLDLAPVRAALPGVPIHLLVRPDWHEPALEDQARALGIGTLQTPLSPDDLAGLAERAAPAPLPPEPAVLAAPGWPPGTRVLLVEDNPVNQLIAQEYLRALGLQVHTVADGMHALQACLDEPPELVLMDLQMPGMDGIEATRRLRALQQEGRWPGAPIVALTAHAGKADHAACLEAGMDGVLTKPLTLQQLRDELGHYRPASAAPAAADRPPAGHGGPPRTNPAP